MLGVSRAHDIITIWVKMRYPNITLVLRVNIFFSFKKIFIDLKKKKDTSIFKFVNFINKTKKINRVLENCT